MGVKHQLTYLLCFPISATREMFKVPSTYRPGIFSIIPETLSCTCRIPTKSGHKICSTGKKNSQILFSLASFLLMSSYSMSRDQIQKQPTVLSLGRSLNGTFLVTPVYLHRGATGSPLGSSGAHRQKYTHSLKPSSTFPRYQPRAKLVATFFRCTGSV